MTERVVITPDTPEETAEAQAAASKHVVEVVGEGRMVVRPNPDAPKDGEPPKKLAGKFDSKEQLEKAYLELQKKLGAPKEETPPAEPPKADPPKDDEPLTIERKPKAEEPASFDMDGVAKEFTEKGELSAETLSGLKKLGLSQKHVETYIAGAKALAGQIRTTLAEAAGGEEQFAAAREWAAENLSDADLASFNTAVQSGDLGVAKLAISGLVAQYRDNVSTPPKKTVGGASGVDTGEYPGFKSNAELTAAMRDPRYAKDPAYRAVVERRMANTK